MARRRDLSRWHRRAMNGMLLLNGDDIRSVLDPKALHAALLDGFVALSRGEVDVPRRIGARAPHGLLAAMPGYVPGVGLVAKLVTIFPDNDGVVPTHQGLVVLFDEHDGRPIAAMDAAAITELRTAAAAALAADLLARADATVLTIIGAGVQARGHLHAFATLRQWTEIRVSNRTRARAERLAAEHPQAVPYDDPRAAVDGADAIALCTAANEPVIERAWLGRGAHVSSVGFGHELSPDVLTAARVVVEARDAATAPPPAGAAELQGIDPATLVELGEIIETTVPGRRSDDELTVYKSTGHAVEDAVASRLVADRALGPRRSDP